MGSILEMIIVLVALTIASLQVFNTEVAAARGLVLSAEGQNEALLNNALQLYQTKNLAALETTVPVVSGFANPLAPTIAELAANKYLSVPNYAAGPFWGGTYATRITVAPAGCSADTCQVTSHLWPTQPITRRGSPDVAGAGQIASAGGTLFGFSGTQNSSVVSGVNGAWTTSNPIAGNPAAAIVAIGGYGTDGNAVYYRRDGTLPLTGPLAGGGQDIDNVGNINATGTITAATENLSPGNALNIGTGATVYGDNANLALRTPGGIFLQGPNGAGAASIDEVGNINSSGTITAPTFNLGTPSGGCQRGQIALAGGNVMYMCNQSNGWFNAGNLIGNVQTVARYLAQTDGSGVGKPTCTGGTPTATIILQTTAVNVATDPPIESTYPQLVDEGGYWYVQISVQDASGAWSSGNVLGLTAEVDTQCQYSNE